MSVLRSRSAQAKRVLMLTFMWTMASCNLSLVINEQLLIGLKIIKLDLQSKTLLCDIISIINLSPKLPLSLANVTTISQSLLNLSNVLCTIQREMTVGRDLWASTVSKKAVVTSHRRDLQESVEEAMAVCPLSLNISEDTGLTEHDFTALYCINQ